MSRKQRWFGSKIIGVSLCLAAVVTPAAATPKKINAAAAKGKTQYSSSLQNFEYKAAFALPFTTLGSTREDYFLLARDSPKMAYSAFGASRWQHGTSAESHPAQTAARGLAGGTFNLLGSRQALMSDMNIHRKRTHHVIVDRRGQHVVYITRVPAKKVDETMRNFRSARVRRIKAARATFTFAAGGIKHKDSLALVRKDHFIAAIKKVKHNRRDKLKLDRPTNVTAQVQRLDGSRKQQQIELDPAFVNSMEMFYEFNDRFSCSPGLEPKVKFCHDR